MPVGDLFSRAGEKGGERSAAFRFQIAAWSIESTCTKFQLNSTKCKFFVVSRRTINILGNLVTIMFEGSLVWGVTG